MAVNCTVNGCENPGSQTFEASGELDGQELLVCRQHHDQLEAGARPVVDGASGAITVLPGS